MELEIDDSGRQNRGYANDGMQRDRSARYDRTANPNRADRAVQIPEQEDG